MDWHGDTTPKPPRMPPGDDPRAGDPIPSVLLPQPGPGTWLAEKFRGLLRAGRVHDPRPPSWSTAQVIGIEPSPDYVPPVMALVTARRGGITYG